MWVFQKIWFSAPRVDVTMSSEEWCERSYLIPSHKHLRVGITEESADVG
jgi:hypothetical protein